MSLAVLGATVGGVVPLVASAAVGAAALIALCAPHAAAQSTLRVRSGATLTPDTVTVGDPFLVQVRVSAPPGATVVFPVAPDTGGAVALLDPKRERAAAVPGGGVDVTATYRAAAWDVGPQPLGLADVVVRVGAAEQRVPLAGLRVVVRSVLPSDSARRIPKPVRAPVADAGLWWLRLAAVAAVAFAVVALLLWLAWRWWRARRRHVPSDAAHRQAVEAFERLERLRLVEAGEGGRHVALAADIARDYLAARRPGAERARTSGELLAGLEADADVPHARLAAMLATADLVKFAGVVLPATDAQGAGRDARRVVDETEAAVLARAEREAAEAEERARAVHAARARYQEERRRAARGVGAAPDGPGDDPPGGDPPRVDVPSARERAA